MSERMSRKTFVNNVANFIKDNAQEIDEIEIRVKVIRSNVLTTLQILEANFYGELEDD